jgi:hypothetical protein
MHHQKEHEMYADLITVRTRSNDSAKACVVEFDVFPQGHVNDSDLPQDWDSSEIPTILRLVCDTIKAKYPKAESALGHITTTDGVALWFSFSNNWLHSV